MLEERVPIDLGWHALADRCTHRWAMSVDASLDATLPRKEVIQPQLPLRLPCYDFVPVTSPTLGACLLAVSSATSGVTDFHDVTGGVYKARERIHRSMLTCGY